MDVPLIKDIHATLSILPVAALAVDAKSNCVRANTHAQDLFALADEVSAVKNTFAHLQFFDLTEQVALTSEDIFNIPKRNARTLQKTTQTSSTIIEFNYQKISPELTLIICTNQSTFTNRYSSDFDEVISKISTQLIDIQLDNLDAQIKSALQTIGTFCNADRSYLFQFNNHGTSMSNTHEWVNEHITPFKEQLQNIPQNSLPYFFKVMSKKHVFNVPDVKLLPAEAHEEKAEFTAEGVKSVLCIGLKSEQELVGFIGCDCVKSTRNWNDTDLIRIKLVGDIITNALKNVAYKQHIEQMQQQLVTANQELKNLAHRDSLTNIANRRQFDNTLQSEIQRSARHQQPISLIICDIDSFKLYNDNFGHQQGDETLKQVANALQQLTKRQGDLVARYGGEEFAFILPFTDSANCFAFTKLIKVAINELAIPHPYSSVSDKLTLSIGYYSTIPNKNTSIKSLIEAADTALYKAKNAGRNTIKAFNK